MAEVRQGRWTAKIEGDFVVFIIGARFDLRNPVRSLVDLGGRMSLPQMLKYLMQHPEKGLLGYEQAGLATTIQYWRSFEHLERFAKDEDDPHLEVWRKYWKRVGQVRAHRHLARDLPGARGGVRGDLRQHAAARPGEGDRADPAVGRRHGPEATQEPARLIAHFCNTF